MFYNVHCHHIQFFEEEQSILSLFADEYIPENQLFSAGFHPWQNVLDTYEYYQTHLSVKLSHQNCVALGEIGLDKVKGVTWDTQLFRFQTQLEITKSYRKPVILHCVKAYYEILSVLNKVKWDNPFIFHGFNKSYSLGKDLLGKGAYLSFGTKILDKNFIHEVFLPLWKAYPTRIFLETDTQKIPVKTLYLHLALELSIDVYELQSNITRTVENVLGIVV